MTSPSLESRVAVLENAMVRVDNRLRGIDDKQQQLLDAFAQVSGEKKALIMLAAIVGGTITLIISLIKIWDFFTGVR